MPARSLIDAAAAWSAAAWPALAIALGSFVTEDGATAAAATLSAAGTMDARVAFAAAFLGIWVGDLGLYGLARWGGAGLAARPAMRRLLGTVDLDRGRAWFERRGAATLLLSRFVPGTRLATLLAAGLARMPAQRFAATTALGSALWVLTALFAARHSAGRAGWFSRHPAAAVLIAVLTAIALAQVGSRLRVRLQTHSLQVRLERLRRWEFWPAWLFYAPVALFCAWLGLRYRGWSLPTAANPSQRNGGVVGESKSEILAALAHRWPELVADAYPVAPGTPDQRLAAVDALMQAHELRFPCVLKPDVGQRGAGFRIVHARADARAYFRQVSAPVILQRYAPGPGEAGIFYYRLPGEARGHLFAVTEKLFPAVVGDGRRTLRELIRADARARLLERTYCRRFGAAAGQVVPAGTRVRLVEAGNHCQGCIFADGSHLATEALRDVIDRIARSLPGFFIGRFDVRYADPEDLRNGVRFRIVELNGAASEATSIYDARNSLASAYRTLYRQWELVYRIGRINRDRGHAPASLARLLRDWLQYRRYAAQYPAAD